jgi:membrane-bound inhibitor of C-type lysozyme
MTTPMEPQMNADERRWVVSKGSDVPMTTLHSLVKTHLRSSAFICGSLLFALPAMAQEPAPAPAPISVRYKCDNKQSVQVDYYNSGKKPRVIVTTSKIAKTAKTPAVPARSWTMNQAISGSGARYEDSKKTMQWWNKGAEGTLTDLKTDKGIHCTEFASSR